MSIGQRRHSFGTTVHALQLPDVEQTSIPRTIHDTQSPRSTLSPHALSSSSLESTKKDDRDVPRRPWWLPGAHLQTAWARLARSRRLVTFEREVLTTSDGDELILDHAPGPKNSPRVLLLHGLEGSAYSLHTQGLAVLVAHAGWCATVLNFRSCARDPADIRRRLPNRRPRLYHAGDTNDVDLVVKRLRRREPSSPLYAVGFSLGGSVLLKWLGDSPNASLVDRAATISVPYDLEASSRFLERPVGRLYVRHFTKRMKTKALDVLRRFPRETTHIDVARVRAARTVREFDECLTAPLHGFANAADYYDRVSAKQYLKGIATPTLCINSEDDPFFPREALMDARERASPSVEFRVTTWGGHTGFVAGPWPWRPSYWVEELVIDWLGQVAQARVA